jgi:hypothetical protein
MAVQAEMEGWSRFRTGQEGCRAGEAQKGTGQAEVKGCEGCSSIYGKMVKLWKQAQQEVRQH